MLTLLWFLQLVVRKPTKSITVCMCIACDKKQKQLAMHCTSHNREKEQEKWIKEKKEKLYRSDYRKLAASSIQKKGGRDEH